jgi:hypothetical protein
MISTHEATVRLPGHNIATVRIDARDPIEALRLLRVQYGAANVIGTPRTLPRENR